MTGRFPHEPNRRLLWLHIATTPAFESHGMLTFVRRLNRFLVSSGLYALIHGEEGILLLSLRGPITAQDAGLAMLWLWRQPQVRMVGIKKPKPQAVQNTTEGGHESC